MAADEPDLLVQKPVHLVRGAVGGGVSLVPQAPLLAQATAGGLVRTRAYWWTLAGQLAGATALAGLALSVGSAGPIGAIFGLTAAALGTLRAFHDRWLRARFDKLPLAEDPAAVERGRIVRVRGTVLDGPHFTSPGTPRGAVVGRFLGRTSVAQPDGLFRGRPKSVEELRGVDFRMRTRGGRELLVKVQRAFLISRDEDFSNHQHIGRPLACEACETPEGTRITELLREELICPGDVVEVIGVVGEEVDGHGSRTALRSPPMLLTVAAGDVMPVLIREVDTDGPLLRP